MDPQPLNSVALFDELADTYDEAIPFFATFGRALVDLLSPAFGTRVLDIASGRGAVAIPCFERGCRVIAVDGAARMAAALRRTVPEIDTQVMDAHKLAFIDDCFDLALMAFAIHCVDDPVVVAQEAKRVVRPGGRVVMTVPGTYSHSDQWERFNHIGDDLERLPGAQETARRIDLPTVLEDAGFSDVEQTSLEIALPVESAEQLWAFQMSHGFAGYVRTFTPPDQVRFRGRALRELAVMIETDDFVLRRGVSVCIAQVSTPG